MDPDALAPPRRIRASAGLDRVHVELPLDLRGLHGAYWIVVVGAGVVMTAAGSGYSLATGLAVGLGFVAAMALPWAIVAALAGLIRRAGPSSWVSRGVLALCALAGLFLTALVVESASWLGWLAFCALAAYAAGTLWRARRPGSLTIHPARLGIRQGTQVSTFPLEEVWRIERRWGWSKQVRIDDREAPALRGLTDAELRWVIELVEGAAQRRRAALEQQGHDLAAPAGPPAELREALERA